MRFVMILALSVLAAAGCGGGSGDRLSKAEFVEQGNAICAKYDGQIETAGQTAFASAGQPTEAEITAFAEDTLLPIVEKEIDELRSLSPPEEDEATVDEILDKAEAAADELSADPALLASDEDPFEETNRLAGSYGLTACAGQAE